MSTTAAKTRGLRPTAQEAASDAHERAATRRCAQVLEHFLSKHFMHSH